MNDATISVDEGTIILVAEVLRQERKSTGPMSWSDAVDAVSKALHVLTSPTGDTP